MKRSDREARVRRAAAALPKGLQPALEALAEKIVDRAFAEAEVEAKRRKVVDRGREEAA